MHHDPLQPYRTFEYDEKVRARFYNYDSVGTHEQGMGRRFVAVEIGKATPDEPKPTATVFTDMSRLEAVAARAHEILQDPNGLGASFATEKVAGQEVTFLAWPTRGKPESLTINLEEPVENGRKTASVSLQQLEAILEDGLTVERELKYDQAECHTLILTDSIKENPETGKIEAKVKECFGKSIEAQLYMHKASFTALLPPMNRPPTGGVVELPPGTILQVTYGAPRTVEQHLETQQMHRERMSEDFKVVKWQYGVPPTIGMNVKVFGTGFEGSNRAFEDFKAHPTWVQKPGATDGELYALVRVNPHHPGFGTVEAVSPIRREMVEALNTAQRDLDSRYAPEQQQKRTEDVSRRLLEDLSKQSFSPHLRRL